MKRLFLIVLLILIICAQITHAQSNDVNLGVNVIERKSTDTINDFVVRPSDEQGRVLGAQAQRDVDRARAPANPIYRSALVYFFTNNLSFVILDYFLYK